MPLEIPRRARIDLQCPAEKAIRDAILVVESMGADERLTQTVELLDKARNVLADYVDEQIANCRPPFEGKNIPPEGTPCKGDPEPALKPYHPEPIGTERSGW